MSIHADRLRWNRKYSSPGFETDWAPDVILAERVKELPQGRALDVACGTGSNALFLAKRGYSVDALDLSDVAIERLRKAAHAEGLESVHLHLADVETCPMEVETYDLVVCFRFLCRPAIPKMQAALKPGGVLIYRTWTSTLRRRRPEFREEYLLRPGELRVLFADFEELYYEEDVGGEAMATFIGRKRASV